MSNVRRLRQSGIDDLIDELVEKREDIKELIVIVRVENGDGYAAWSGGPDYFAMLGRVRDLEHQIVKSEEDRERKK